MKKQAELTTQQIVILIIAITSFAVLLFLFMKLGFGEETNAEICRNSVIMKGGSIVSSDAMSLNCHRDYLCITNDGTCEGLTKPKIEKVEDTKEIYEILANEMTDCWWMFGEGKINYVGGEIKKDNYCSICSQIIFDDSLNDLEEVRDGKISKDKLYDYLSEKNYTDEGLTYADYLFGTSDMNSLRQETLDQYGTGATFGSMEIGKPYFVVMGITSEVSKWSWAGIGAGIGAAIGVVAIFSNPVGWIIGGVIVGVSSGVGGYSISEAQDTEIAAISVKGKGIDNYFMSPTILEVNSVKFDALKCEEILTLP